MTVVNKILKGAGALVTAFVLAGVLVVGAVPNGASANPLKPYCKNEEKKNCLEPIEVSITSACVGGEVSFTFTFNNPNNEDAPRNITMYLEGEEFFEDSGFAAPGESTLTFGPLEGEWRAVVWWDDLVFAEHSAGCQ